MANADGEDSTPRDEAWRKHHTDVLDRMSEERLRDATIKQNREQMEQLLQHFTEENNRYDKYKQREAERIRQDRGQAQYRHHHQPRKAIEQREDKKAKLNKREQLVWDAREMLEVMDEKDKLEAVVEKGDYREIYREVDRIRESALRPHLMFDTTKAESQADKLRRQHTVEEKISIMQMDQKTMSELRRYHNPPASVLEVMQAALLLMGEDEATTSDWKACQRMCNPHGAKGMNRRLLEHDSSKVHPEIAARSKQILDKNELAKIKAVSAGASTFYVWAYGVIDECENNSSQGTEDRQQQHSEVRTNSDGSAKPANIKRQRELFGRQPPPSPEWKRKNQRRYYRPSYHHDNDGLSDDDEKGRGHSPANSLT